jgi:nuclear transport factor 2 (NTF2) superfamily protein
VNDLPYNEPMKDEPRVDRPPLPPFNERTAAQKVQSAEDAWNTRNPERVAAAYTPDSMWRNRSEFIMGRTAIIKFLTDKWEREQIYALRKNLWSFGDDRIAVRFQYEWHDQAGQWWRSYGNELWEFDSQGYMKRREASINDVGISIDERRIFGSRETEDRDDSLPIE